MSDKIEGLISEIGSMLRERMNEDDVFTILGKVRDLAESAWYEGYSEGHDAGCDETNELWSSMNNEDY